MQDILVDAHGVEIHEDDILTYDWFRDISNSTMDLLNEKFNGDIEAITEYFMTPMFRVTKCRYGLQGVDIDYKRNLLLHEDRFKYTRKIS